MRAVRAQIASLCVGGAGTESEGMSPSASWPNRRLASPTSSSTWAIRPGDVVFTLLGRVPELYVAVRWFPARS